jgi:hypothetical protein
MCCCVCVFSLYLLCCVLFFFQLRFYFYFCFCLFLFVFVFLCLSCFNVCLFCLFVCLFVCVEKMVSFVLSMLVVCLFCICICSCSCICICLSHSLLFRYTATFVGVEVIPLFVVELLVVLPPRSLNEQGVEKAKKKNCFCIFLYFSLYFEL